MRQKTILRRTQIVTETDHTAELAITAATQTGVPKTKHVAWWFTAILP